MLMQLKSAFPRLPGLRAFAPSAIDIRNIDVAAAAAQGAPSGHLRRRQADVCETAVRCPSPPARGLPRQSTAPPLWGLEGRAVTVQAASTENRDPKGNEAGQGHVP